MAAAPTTVPWPAGRRVLIEIPASSDAMMNGLRPDNCQSVAHCFVELNVPDKDAPVAVGLPGPEDSDSCLRDMLTE